MKVTHRLFGMVSVTLASALFLVSGNSAFAKKGTGGPNSDSSDPDYAISAIADTSWSPGAPLFAPDDCFAANPDQKGPGVSYSAFFPQDGCASSVTSNGAVLSDPINIFMSRDDNDDIIELEFRGRVIDPSTGDETLNIGSLPLFFSPPADESFTIHVHANVPLYGCHGKGKNQACDIWIGDIAIADLHYALQP